MKDDNLFITQILDSVRKIEKAVLCCRTKRRGGNFERSEKFATSRVEMARIELACNGIDERFLQKVVCFRF